MKFSHVTLSFLLVCSARSQLAPTDLIRDLMVQIRCGDRDFGGGLVFSQNRDRVNIMTANHVLRACRDSRRAQVTFSDRTGRALEAEIHDQYSTEPDLAVLSVVAPNRFFSFEVLGKPNSIVENSDVRVFSHGSSNAWKLSTVLDRVTRREDYLIYFQSQSVSRGSSGGALLDRDGFLVGMITADDSREGTALSITTALRVLRGWRYEVAYREAVGPPPAQRQSAIVEYPNQPPPVRTREERHSNTIFQMPAGWLRQRHPADPGRLMLTHSGDVFRQTNPQYWIEIAQSGRLKGDFEAAFDASLRPQGYEPELGQTASLTTDKGFTMLSVSGMMRNQKETIFFTQVSANPGDRYEEVVFCARSEFQMRNMQETINQFLAGVDYQNARDERARR